MSHSKRVGWFKGLVLRPPISSSPETSANNYGVIDALLSREARQSSGSSSRKFVWTTVGFGFGATLGALAVLSASKNQGLQAPLALAPEYQDAQFSPNPQSTSPDNNATKITSSQSGLQLLAHPSQNKNSTQSDDPIVVPNNPQDTKPPKSTESQEVKIQGFIPGSLNEDVIKNRKEQHAALLEITDFRKRLSAVAKYAKPGVVFIEVFMFASNKADHWIGSGYIHSSDDSGSYIVTNAHVVGDNAEKENKPAEPDEDLLFSKFTNKPMVFVRLLDEKITGGEVIGIDKDSDLAVIRIPDKNLPTLELADSDPNEPDDNDSEPVLAIGNPHKLGWSTTFGIKSGRNRELPGLKTKVTQTDAHLNEGNSGGVLVNMDGDVIAITQSRINLKEVQGLGFAIPAPTVKTVVQRLIEEHKKKEALKELNSAFKIIIQP